MNMPSENRKPSFAEIQFEIANMLDVPDEELDDEQKKAMDLYLNELAAQESEKIDGFAQFVKLNGIKAKALRDEARSLESKARTVENRLEFLKLRYKEIMQAHNLKKIKGNCYTLSLRKSQSVEILDKGLIPSDYLRIIEPEPRKSDIMAAIKEGKEVPGACLREKESLAIR